MMPLITDFKAYLTSAGYGKGSVSLLPAIASDFLEHCALTDIQLTEPHHVHLYHHHLGERPGKHRSGGLSETYIHHHVYALRVLLPGWKKRAGSIITRSARSASPGPKEVAGNRLLPML
ncbi:hypothetical protein [Hufsiella ginkgonis]|uniref:Integrase n=1 Tax=Hufsiella ginkgonis TaxID=2695274 RepID=A0A7K1XSD1_9SPHI|nr:hypothetical protein [Hufsiella ginkgonis]MXV13907.1 hypothetical protein [Hufsiella ginkgonis]MXV13915.1 hypothetical protein [Hufsiella ginkgonis]